MNTPVETIHDHIVILGWSPSVERIIGELRNEVHRISGDVRPILVVCPVRDVELKGAYERTYFIYGDVNDLEVLQRANLARAHSVLIPSVFRDTTASDGEAVFALMAALSVNRSLRVCVELASSRNTSTLDVIRRRELQSGDIEIVSLESVAERLLAQSAVNPGITRVYDHLLSFGEDSNEIYITSLGQEWVGKTFRELHTGCFEREVIVIGYERAGEMLLNPKDRDARLQAGDKIWFIAYNRARGIAAIGGR